MKNIMRKFKMVNSRIKETVRVVNKPQDAMRPVKQTDEQLIKQTEKIVDTSRKLVAEVNQDIKDGKYSAKKQLNDLKPKPVSNVKSSKVYVLDHGNPEQYFMFMKDNKVCVLDTGGVKVVKTFPNREQTTSENLRHINDRNITKDDFNSIIKSKMILKQLSLKYSLYTPNAFDFDNTAQWTDFIKTESLGNLREATIVF